MTSAYLRSLEAFYSRFSDGEYSFFRNHEGDIGLGSAQTVLSIGAGYGRTERQLKKAGLLGSLVEYHAVEPDQECVKGLHSCLPKLLPGVKIIISEKTAERYEGPPNKFDVILIMKMLNHVQDKAGLIQRAGRWLKPGGKLIIEEIAQESSISKFRLSKGLYTQLYRSNDLVADLKQLGISFEAYNVDYEMFLGNFNKELANFYHFKEVTDEEYEDVKNFVNACVSSDVEMFHYAVCVIVRPLHVDQIITT